MGREPENRPGVNIDFAAGRDFEAGDHHQGGGLARAARTQQYHEFARLDGKAQIVDRRGGAEPLIDMVEHERGSGAVGGFVLRDHPRHDKRRPRPRHFRRRMKVGAPAFTTRRRQRRNIFVLLLPLIAYLGMFYAYPIAAMMFRSISEPYWTVEHFAKLFYEGIYLHVLWMTTEIATGVTLAALLLGYPVAYLLARLDRAKSNLLLILVLVPFWTSVLVRTYAWMVLLGRQGVVNQLLLAIGVIDQPLRSVEHDLRRLHRDGARTAPVHDPTTLWGYVRIGRGLAARLWLPKIVSGLAQMPRWVILASGCLTS